MESAVAIVAERRSACRDFNDPLRWIGADRVLLDDVTVHGLRRLVCARRGEPPAVADLLEIVAGITDADVYAWCVLKDDGVFICGWFGRSRHNEEES